MKYIIMGIMVCAGTLYGAEKKERSAQERKEKRAEASAAKFVFARKPKAKTLPATRSAPDMLKDKKPKTPPSPSATTDVPRESIELGGRPELFSNMGWKPY